MIEEAIGNGYSDDVVIDRSLSGAIGCLFHVTGSIRRLLPSMLPSVAYVLPLRDLAESSSSTPKPFDPLRCDTVTPSRSETNLTRTCHLLSDTYVDMFLDEVSGVGMVSKGFAAIRDM